MLLAGVIGKPAKVIPKLLFSAAVKIPKHEASVPFIFLYLPLGSFAFSTMNLVVNISAVSP